MTIHSTATRHPPPATRHPRLKSAQFGRAAGVLAAAVGDALGVPYVSLAPTSMVLRGGDGPEVAFVPVDRAHAIDSSMKQEGT